METPFNPNRMEQRNGRVDRHLQPNPEVYIHHFVSADYANGGGLAADLQFLSIVARKLETIRDDLGSVGEVLGTQVQEAMLGSRSSLDESTLSSARMHKARAQLARLERDLRERFRALHAKAVESRVEMGINPDTLHRSVAAGLALGRQAPLEPVQIPAVDGFPAVAGYRVPQLTRSWASAAADLFDPIRGVDRPITFDPAAAGRDDVVLAHLGSRLVARSLRLLRAQIWASGADASISRVAAQVTDAPTVADLTVIAHARVVITGADGRRLHEEVIYSGGRLPRQGRFSRIESLTDLRSALAAPVTGTPDRTVEEQIESGWADRIRDPLYRSLEARFKDRVESLEKTLAKAAEREKADITSVLTELRATILTRLENIESDIKQLELPFGDPQARQAETDVAGLRARLDAIPAEIVEEQRLIDARYADVHPLMFPAAVTFIVPGRFSSDWAGL
jgi:hypothetical protein